VVLSRNFGQSAAMMAGFDYAAGGCLGQGEAGEPSPLEPL